SIETAQLHAQLEPSAEPISFFREEALQRARAVETDEIAIERVDERHLADAGELVIQGRDNDEAVCAKGKHFQAGEILRAGNDADIGLTVCHRSDDLVAQALLE